MSVFARGGLANRLAAVSPIVRSVLGTNALRPHAAWAAGALRIRGGTSLESSRQRKARAAGAIVRSLPGCTGMSLVLRRTTCGYAGVVPAAVIRTAALP